MRQNGKNVSPMSNEGRNSYVLEHLTNALLSFFLVNANDRAGQFNQMYIAGGFYNVYKFWLMGGCKETPEELADMFITKEHRYA